MANATVDADFPGRFSDGGHADDAVANLGTRDGDDADAAGTDADGRQTDAHSAKADSDDNDHASRPVGLELFGASHFNSAHLLSKGCGDAVAENSDAVDD
jgi:hypothetical protein